MDIVNEVVAVLEQLKSWASDKEKEAIEYAVSALRKGSSEYAYRMVRSFSPASYQSGDELDKYLAAGYEFVRASEFVQPQGNKAGYIEYILRRKKEEGMKNEGND